MYTNIINCLKEYQWLILLVSTLITLLFAIRKNLVQRINNNKELYNNTLQSNYQQLFQSDKSNLSSEYKHLFDNYNVLEISKFCCRIIDFKTVNNKFSGLLTKYYFYRLFIIAKELNLKTSNNDFIIKYFDDSIGAYLELYENNKTVYEKLKKRFVRLYSNIHNNF